MTDIKEETYNLITAIYKFIEKYKCDADAKVLAIMTLYKALEIGFEQENIVQKAYEIINKNDEEL